MHSNPRILRPIPNQGQFQSRSRRIRLRSHGNRRRSGSLCILHSL